MLESNFIIKQIEDANGGVLPRIKFGKKYRNEYCVKLLKFFNRDAVVFEDVEMVSPQGKKYTKRETVSPDLPLFGKFELEHGLVSGQCAKWANAKDKYDNYRYPDFRECYLHAKQLQADVLVNATLRGSYPAQGFATLVAKNLIGWRDKQEHTGLDGGPITTREVGQMTKEEVDDYIQQAINGSD